MLETSGLVTTSISLVREHTEAVKPPRALFVPFPYGHALGAPHDSVLQHRVLRAALDITAEARGPVLRDFPDDGVIDEPPAPTQASAVTATLLTSGDSLAEVNAMIAAHPRWLASSGGRTAFGLSGMPLARFADAVATLQAFADTGADGAPVRPAEVPLPAFLRWCADDLKALAWESYMIGKPDAGGDEIARWFWGETAAGQLLRRVRDRLDTSSDPSWKAAAFGVAR